MVFLNVNPINMKQEVFYFDEFLEEDHEYSLEELMQACNDKFEEVKRRQWQGKSVEITRFTLESTTESGYYGDSYARFKMRFYRLEFDKEEKDRIQREKEKLEEEHQKRIKQIEKDNKKKLLAKDPEYMVFLQLKEKFKGI